MSVFLPGELLLDFHRLAGVKLDPEAHCVRLLSCWKQETHQCESSGKDGRQATKRHECWCSGQKLNRAWGLCKGDGLCWGGRKNMETRRQISAFLPMIIRLVTSAGWLDITHTEIGTGPYTNRGLLLLIWDLISDSSFSCSSLETHTHITKGSIGFGSNNSSCRNFLLGLVNLKTLHTKTIKVMPACVRYRQARDVKNNLR